MGGSTWYLVPSTQQKTAPDSNLLLEGCVLITMEPGITIAVVVNFLLIGGCIVYGFALLAEYHSTGRWSKNVTGLLAGLGMMFLALALMLRPGNAMVLWRVAQTNASKVLLAFSSGLLLAAIAAFGILTHVKPLRLKRQKKLESDLTGELPHIP